MTAEQAKPLINERMLNAPIEKVWQALTDEGQLKEWSSYISNFKPEVGFEFRFELGPDPEHQFLHICEVTEVVENKKLTYSWRYDGYEGISYLTFELSAEGQKTKLKKTWAGLESFPTLFTRAGFEEGSKYQLDALQKFVEDN
jgi:uncharacterized protein YndB with AHSA1/START domain